MRSIYDNVPVPAARWPMNDNAASTVVKEIMAGLNGAASQNTEDMHATGEIGGALDFNGTDDKVAVADADALDVTAITMSARVKLDATWSSTGYIVAKMEEWGAGGKVSYTLSIDSNRNARIGVSDDGDNKEFEVADDAMSLSESHHIVGTYDAGVYKIYVDGILVTSDGGGGATGAIHVDTGRLTLGARYDAGEAGYKTFFKGLVEDVRIIHKALVANQVRKLYDNRGKESIYDNRPNRIYHTNIKNGIFGGTTGCIA